MTQNKKKEVKAIEWAGEGGTGGREGERAWPGQAGGPGWAIKIKGKNKNCDSLHSYIYAYT